MLKKKKGLEGTFGPEFLDSLLMIKSRRPGKYMKLGSDEFLFPYPHGPLWLTNEKKISREKKIVNNVFVSCFFFFFPWTISVLLKCWSQNGYAQTGIKRVCGQVNSIVYQRQEVNKTLELGSGKSERLWFQLNSHQYSIGTPTQSHLIFIWGNSVGEFIYLFLVEG